jgi:hypothetical protein
MSSLPSLTEEDGVRDEQPIAGLGKLQASGRLFLLVALRLGVYDGQERHLSYEGGTDER